MQQLGPYRVAKIFLWFAVFFAGFCNSGFSQDTVNMEPFWVKVTDTTGWRPRDSSGEVVYKKRMWIFGGWHNSLEAPPRDVWSTKDGLTWKLVTPVAPWKHSDFMMTTVFKKKMWVMGGWYNGRLPGHSASNMVWSSKDGKTWKLVTDKARWSPRMGGCVTTFKGKMWVLGGTENYYFGDSTSLKNDVWYSENGVTWKLATPHAGWSPRAYFSCVEFEDKLWVMGGGNYTPEYQALNDVWSSEDGVHWKQVTAQAPWTPRIWFSGLVYKNYMWVLGGWSNNPSRNWADVWYSRDGQHWHELKSSMQWKRRHEHSTYVFDDKIWVIGGYADGLDNDVWWLSLPAGWAGK